MAFLTIEELNTVATDQVVQNIINSDESIVEEIILESIEIMKSFLYRYYDAEKIFKAEGEERSKVIVKFLKDIVIYEVYHRRTKQLNEVAKLRFDEAMLWLDKVSKGSIDADLPLLEGENEVSSFLKLGSRKTYNNHW